VRSRIYRIDWREAQFSMGCDIGWYPGPVRVRSLVVAHARSMAIYEVASWRQTHLTSDQQVAVLREVRESHVNDRLRSSPMHRARRSRR
jgi:hypothetical protein